MWGVVGGVRGVVCGVWGVNREERLGGREVERGYPRFRVECGVWSVECVVCSGFRVECVVCSGFRVECVECSGFRVECVVKRVGQGPRTATWQCVVCRVKLVECVVQCVGQGPRRATWQRVECVECRV